MSKLDDDGAMTGCDTCLHRKNPIKTKQDPMQIIRTGSPMERVATDILGGLLETEN